MEKDKEKAQDQSHDSTTDKPQSPKTTDDKDESKEETKNKDESTTAATAAAAEEKYEANNVDKGEIETKDNNDAHEEDGKVDGDAADNNNNSELENKEGDPTDADVPEETLPPPDLSKVSEEIDKFLSYLLSLETAGNDESEPLEIPEFVKQFAFLVEARITNYDSGESPVKWSQLNEEDTSSFLEIVDRVSKLSTSIRKFTSQSTYVSSINHIGAILQRAMSYLEDEFRSIVEDHHSTAPDPDSSSNNNSNNNDSKTKSSNEDTGQSAGLPSEPTDENRLMGYSEEVVSSMNRLAKAILSGGHEAEICQAYFIGRRNALDHNLHKLGFEKFCIDDMQKMQWEPLEREIVAWIKTFKEFVNVIFPAERKLMEAVFSDYNSVSESLFGSLFRGVMIQLLNFSEAVTMTKRSAEKLFKFLDIYETLRDLIPSMESLFPAGGVDELKAEATLTRGRLGDAMVCIFGELENSVKADSGKTPVPGGAVHPLTRYTLNYLKYACEYKDTLEQVFREHQKIERADSATITDYDFAAGQGQNEKPGGQSSFEVQLRKVMDLLDANLEAKSKLYKDTSLSLIFMMNNGRYILQKIKGAAEINSLMGDPWYRKRSSDLRQYHKNYQRETWMKLLQSLQAEGLVVHGKVVKPVLKERFKSFNAMFDEIHRTQSTWIVSDEQLQSELRVSISAVVIPAYRSFVARFSQVFTPGRQVEKYIKYQPEDIETHIDELFDGNSTPMGRGNRK
ncbi:hypothetical protein LguiA_016918 [Lonicera macranthoides]